MGYAVLNVSKLHTFAQVKELGGHIERKFNTENVDLSRSDENKTLVGMGGMEMTQLWEKKMKDAAKRCQKTPKKHKNSVIVLEIVTGMSKDAKVDDIDAWAEKNAEWMKKTFGEENILSCVLHMDETTPHIHTEVIPITKDGRLCAKDFTAGKYAMARLQTNYGKAMEEFGLSRGERNTKAKKVRLEKFYNAVNRVEETKLPPVRTGESLDDYIVRMEEHLKALKMENLKLRMELTQERVDTRTKVAQEFSRYTDAVAFYDELEESFGGDTDMVKDRLCQYRRLEMIVPRKELKEHLDDVEMRYQPRDNVFLHFMDEKKKKRLGIDLRERLDLGDDTQLD